MNLSKSIKKLYYFSGLSVVVQWIVDTLFISFFYRVIYNTSVEFTEARPDPCQPYIIIANHRSYKDPPLVGHAMKRSVSFIAKKELFTNPFLHAFMSLTSTISVDRANADISTFRMAQQALKSKSFGRAWCVGIFIEGTRSKSETELGKPNKGPLLLAKLARVPIIPMGISYRGEKNIIVKFGAPYEIDYNGDLEDQSWQCLEKISKLCDYSLPERR